VNAQTTVLGYDPPNGEEWPFFFGPDNSPYAQLTFSQVITGSSLLGITVNGNTPLNVELNTYNQAQLRIYYFYDWDSSFEIFVPVGAVIGLANNIVYTFTTPPNLAISFLSPENNATGVVLNADVKVTFNKNVFTHGLFTPPVTITKTGGEIVTGVSYVPITPINPSKVLIINHDNFEYDAEYTVLISPDVIPAWGQPITWKFSTKSPPQISVVEFEPENGKEWFPFFGSSIHPYVTIRFNESIEGNLFQGITVNGNPPLNVELNPYNKSVLRIYYDFDWDSNFEIFVPESAIEGLEGDIIYTFNTPPEILEIASLEPVNNATGIALKAEISVTFNKKAMTTAMGTPIVTITKTGGGDVDGVGFVPMTPINPTNKLVINHDDFEYDSEYTVAIPPNLVMGWSEPITWKFSTLSIPTFTIISSVIGEGGKIEPSVPVTVNLGENQTYSITPDEKYKIINVMIDGVNNPEAVATGIYQFTSINKDHTIVAKFEENQKINENELSDWIIYPNPVTDKILIRNTSQIFNTIIIIDIWGKEVEKITHINKNEIDIDMSNLINGIYFITIDSTTVKIVKQ
jgi:hypothetical protein